MSRMRSGLLRDVGESMQPLSDLQRLAAKEIPGNLIVSAPPGSGKTRTLIARAQHKIKTLPKWRTLALITYTNAGADEIEERLPPDCPVFLGTIHRFCLEFILRPFSWLEKWPRHRLIKPEEVSSLVAERDWDLGDNPQEVLNSIRKRPDGSIDPGGNWAPSIPLEQVASAYWSFLDRCGAVDFNEILFRSFSLLSRNVFIGKSLANFFYEILVDEFQDTSELQFRMLMEIHKNGPTTFFLVGDSRQSILRFAGAIRDSFSVAKIAFAAEEVVLRQVYRSTDHIVRGYRSLFQDHPEVENCSSCKSGPQQIIVAPDGHPHHDMRLLAAIEWLHKSCNVELGKIAILSTRWRDGLEASVGLRSRFPVVGLGALPHPMKNLRGSSFELLRSVAKFNVLPSLSSLRGLIRAFEVRLLEVGSNLNQVTFHQTLNRMISEVAQIDRDTNVIAGLHAIRTIFESSICASHSELAEISGAIPGREAAQWSLGKYFSALAGEGGIWINVIHQAKGLEFEAVILDHVDRGRIPYQKYVGGFPDKFAPLKPDDLEDGRNLLYVGMSRARKFLILFHSSTV